MHWHTSPAVHASPLTPSTHPPISYFLHILYFSSPPTCTAEPCPPQPPPLRIESWCYCTLCRCFHACTPAYAIYRCISVQTYCNGPDNIIHLSFYAVRNTAPPCSSSDHNTNKYNCSSKSCYHYHTCHTTMPCTYYYKYVYKAYKHERAYYNYVHHVILSCTCKCELFLCTNMTIHYYTIHAMLMYVIYKSWFCGVFHVYTIQKPMAEAGGS